MTVLELLIVIAIISILAAMTASAVFKIRESQEKKFTETTITKLASILDQHWKAVVDKSRKDYPSFSGDARLNLDSLVKSNSGDRRDSDRGLLTYIKLRLKQEFPTSFQVAMDPALVGSTVYLPPTVVKVGSSGVSVQATGKPSYVALVAEYRKRQLVPDANLRTDTSKDPPANVQSAMLLLAALEQSREGLPAISADQLVGSSFIRSNDELSPGTVLPRYFVDAWGRPLQLFIFPTVPNLSSTDLDGARDPQDPEGLLVQAPGKWQPPAFFSTLVHPSVVNRRLVPVIASLGQDGDLGGNPAALNPFMDLQQTGANDNIYSFRLRQTGARGD